MACCAEVAERILMGEADKQLESAGGVGQLPTQNKWGILCRTRNPGAAGEALCTWHAGAKVKAMAFASVVL